MHAKAFSYFIKSSIGVYYAQYTLVGFVGPISVADSVLWLRVRDVGLLCSYYLSWWCLIWPHLVRFDVFN
ncbi:hypothetical protein BDW62DRAFT_173574, partial [Aspergillus aurantiobrunneus]